MLLLLASCRPHLRHSPLDPLPDPRLTPGDTGFFNRHHSRHVTAAVKKKVYRSYGITRAGKGKFVIDHLIPLELHGSNSVKNLWPEPATGEWNAKKKDRLENELSRRVASGSLDLRTAQRAIADQWIEAYRVYVVEK